MGRPRKQTVDYFPHFVSTDSRTKFILEQSWGNDGYAFWFKLLELLGRSEGHYYDCSAAANEKYLVALMKIDESTINDILATLADLGNIDKKLWDERKVIWCQSLVDNLQDVYSKRTVSAPMKPFEEKQPEQKPEEKPAPPAEEKQPEKNPQNEADQKAGSTKGKICRICPHDRGGTRKARCAIRRGENQKSNRNPRQLQRLKGKDLQE